MVILTIAVASATTAFALGVCRGRRAVQRFQTLLASAQRETRLADAQVGATLDSLDEAIVVVGSDMAVLRHNAAAVEILAGGNDTIARWDGAALRDLLDGEGLPLSSVLDPVERAFATHIAQPDTILGSGAENHRRWFVARAIPVRLADNGADREFVVLRLRDITHSRSIEREQRAFAKRLRVLHAIATQTTENDGDRIETALRFALEELGLDQAYLGAVDEATNELVMQNVLARNAEPTYGPGRRYSLAQTLIGRVVESDDVFAAPDVVSARAAHGVRLVDEWKCYIASSIRFAGKRYGAIGFKGRTVRDEPFPAIDTEFVRITGDLIAASIERGLQSERLAALAFYDALTGLPNRVLLNDRLTQYISAARRHEARFALLFLDLDGFKSVNDALGHAAGDDVLKIFAAHLTAAAREGDTVARLGGDEFVVLAPNIETVRDAREFAARIAESARYSLSSNGTTIDVTASIGVSLFPDDGSDAQTLLRCADAAMFAAKSRARGSVMPVAHAQEAPPEQLSGIGSASDSR